MRDAMVWKERINSNYLEDWMLIIILVSVILIAYVRVRNHEVFATLTSSIINPKILTKEITNQLGWTDLEKTLLLTVFFLVSSLFYTLILLYFFPQVTKQTTTFAFFAVFFVFSLFLYFIRLSILSIIQFITGEYEFLQEYSFSIGQYFRFMGLVLLPLGLLIAIFPEDNVSLFIYPGLIILGIMYLVRILRLITNSLKIEGGFFYIILYLCTFEFLPVLIAIHFLKVFLTR